MNEQHIAGHYRSLLNEFGDTADSAQWSDKKSQFRRFKVLNKIGDLAGNSVLDYGCGCGAFAQYLNESNQSPSLYCGVDLVEEFFEYARLKQPNGIFCRPDQLKQNSSFDYSFVSGVFNNKFDTSSQFWRETISYLFGITQKGLAFNMLSTFVEYRDPDLYYVDPCVVFEFVKTQVSPYVSIHHDYLPRSDSYPYEFTVFVRKDPVNID